MATPVLITDSVDLMRRAKNELRVWLDVHRANVHYNTARRREVYWWWRARQPGDWTDLPPPPESDQLLISLDRFGHSQRVNLAHRMGSRIGISRHFAEDIRITRALP